MEKHLDNVAIPCNFCGLVNPSIIALQRHKAKAHKPKKSKSESIEETDNTNEDLLLEETQDLVIDEDPVPVKDKNEETDHSCGQCGKKTGSLKNLKKHQKKHHPGTRFDCNQCSSNFSSYGHLNRHIQDNHEGREFPCSQCDFQTTSNNKLIRHVKKIHSI